jgi:choline-glycine betaine transporter
LFKNPLLLIALTLTGLIATWGIIDTAGLAQFSSTMTGVLFTSRAWFIMLSVSLLLILCIWLAISPYGKIKLGKDDDEPEFSTVSWLTMLFAAGMGVGLLFWGTASGTCALYYQLSLGPSRLGHLCRHRSCHGLFQLSQRLSNPGKLSYESGFWPADLDKECRLVK